MPVVAEVPLFVSSPSDCAREKRAIFECVSQFNESLGRELGLLVDAFDSERIYATVGEYAQAGVNRQLRDFEVYVGVWRERRGTRTPVARSGTEEELHQALQRFVVERRPYIMAYFRAGSEFDDIKQLLKEHGRFFHTYTDAAHLGRLVWRHLSDFFRDEYRRPGHSATTGPGPDGPGVHVTLDLRRADGRMERLSFTTRTVSVGRNPDINDIVVSDGRVHREQGLYVWDGVQLQYVDLAGDSLVNASGAASGARYPISEEDSVTLPDGTEIVLRAIVS